MTGYPQNIRNGLERPLSLHSCRYAVEGVSSLLIVPENKNSLVTSRYRRLPEFGPDQYLQKVVDMDNK